LQGKPKSTITRRLNTKRDELPGAITNIIVKANYTSGKWILLLRVLLRDDSDQHRKLLLMEERLWYVYKRF